MANRNVPPQWPGDDGRWESRPHPTTDRYRERPVAYATQEQRGPRWVGPDGGIGMESVAGLPEPYDEDDDEPGTDKGRRRALMALGGALAVAGGGAALSFTDQGRGLIDKLLGDGGVDATAAELNNAISNSPAQQQPSTVRTYTEQNESYMGSRAGNELRRNAPATGRVYATPSEAAANTKVTVKTALAKDPVLHLARRATFGPTPKVIADIRRLGIDNWIRLQLDPAKIAPTAGELKLGELTTLNMSIAQVRANRDALNERGTQADQEVVDGAVGRMIFSERQLLEVMVDFWNDFLHVGPFFDGSDMVRSSFDRDVIRKHALGRYPEMLVAANRHPALLIYLNQNQSSKDNVNENLARENLELYSVGVDGGYTEKDVKQAALLQTGRGVRDDQYVYQPERHHVGPVKIMGFSHPNGTAEGGEAASDAYFRFLGLHPSTARYIALNLAVRFVSDTPPKSLIDRLAKTYTANAGAIKPVLMTLFRSSEFWAAVGQKVRRPMEYLAATYRTLGVSPTPSPGFQQGNRNRTPFAEGLRQIRNKMDELGQFPTGQATPNGYPDIFLAWTSAGTMINGWNEALDIVNGNRRMFSYVTPEKFAGAKPPATAGAYVDALAKRLVHQTLSAKEKAALLGIAGVAANAKVDASLNGALTSVVRALLASPQHHLR
ncbi:DUF1800 domain-containing protein [Asanoa iriomotensis]|uniref:DUF1800 domain-containing protein n=1 Tax=Asanoa iriomotensis TaxID=234613 RepID=A0ABQ4C6K1_9ACTN|nr:DUF1800 domain-containing protein [Asanoa iriomotensis]GIF58408.1 hypothetical protein Air01nite_45030 [Asanoa iriomotensis]